MWWDEHIIVILLVLSIVSTMLAVFHSLRIKPWASQNLAAGRIWPTGRTLDMPGLSIYPLSPSVRLCGSKELY